MALDHDFLRANTIEVEAARRMAKAYLHLGIRTGSPGMEDWRGVNLGTPTTIHDLNGLALFHDMPVIDAAGEQRGLVRANANSVIGSLATAVYVGGPRWGAGEAERRARRLIREKHRGEVTATQVVCYAYPKLGIAVDWLERRAGERRTIFDLSDMSEVPPRIEADIRGAGAFSVYDEMDAHSAEAAVDRHPRLLRIVEEIQERSKLDLALDQDWEQFALLQSVVGVFLEAYTTKLLTFCTHGYSHECMRMHAQETGVWCVPATGQMLLDFWRYSDSQSDVAAKMNTGSTGTGWTGEVNGLEALTCSHFDATADMTATFNEAKAEIDANRPFDYSYSYHAMACAGYRQQNIVALGSTPQQSVYLYDPWPVNVGSIRWETWGSGISPVAGFVYLRRT